MPFLINGTELPSGVVHPFNNEQIKKIFFNGTQVYEYDNTAPTITVTSSVADTVHAAYTLTGTVVDTESGVASVTINGVAVTLSGNTFSKAFTLSTGSNTFTIVATDNAGNTRTQTATVNRINDSGTTANNWGTTRVVDSYYGNQNHHFTQIANNGAWYSIKDHGGGGDGDGWPSGRLSFSTSNVPLPKGISSVTFTIRQDGSIGREGDSRGGTLTVTIKDKTTNTTISTNTITGTRREGDSNSGTFRTTYTVNISEAQSAHNLVVDASGYVDCGGSGSYWGEIGITDYSFAWYT